ncbi:MAG: glycosyltransferase family 39 protein [Candidatus Eisenbacteria bacterium]|nr:glycosyltransferase family 39 protein [Candidatus Eisenbacteria bacterium]
MSRRSRPARTRPGAPSGAPADSRNRALSGAGGASAASAAWLGAAAVAVAALLGAALIAMVIGPHRVGDVFTETDFYGGYAEGARAILAGHVDPTRYGVVGPVYEFTLALVGIAVRDLFAAAELISIAATVAGVLLWFALLARRTSAKLALLAVLFLAANATLFRYGYSATTDALAFALQALALWLLLARERPRDALLAGLAAAAAFLTRYNAAVLLPAGLAAIALGGTLQPRRSAAALRFALGFAAPVVPWVLFSLARGGTLGFQLHHNIAYDVFARSKGIVWDDYQKLMQPQFKSLWDVIARDPGAVARRELFNLGDHLRLDARDLLGVPVAIAAGIGLVLAACDGTLRRLWPVALAAALTFLALVPVFYSPRYALPLLPFDVALAATLFVSPLLARAFGRRVAALAPLLAIVPLAFAVRASAREQAGVIRQLPVEVLQIARTLRAEARPGDAVISRKPHIAFHAGLHSIAFPFTRTLPELADYARAHGARWLYFSWPEAEMRPDYSYLLDTSAVVPGLTVRRATTDHPAVLYAIGPEFGAVPAWVRNDTLLAFHTARARLLLNPLDPRALYALGMVARVQGRYAEAAGYLDRAAAVRPRDLPTALLQGEVYLLAGDLNRAEVAFRRALAIDPASLPVAIGLGWLASYRGRNAEAAAFWRPVVGLTRDGATLRRMIATFERTGDAAAAAEARAALARLSGRP